MARQITFQTVKTPKGWRVNIPATLSKDGTRQRRFFPTQKAAIGFLQSLKIRKENFGVASGILKPWQEEQAAKAFELLEEHPEVSMTLHEIVSGFLRERATKNASVTFLEAFESFEGSDSGRRSESYLRSLRQYKNRLASLHEKMLCDIQAGDIDAAMQGFPASVYNYGLRILGGVFHHGMKRDWCSSNPLEKLDRKRTGVSEVQIYSPEEVQKIMAAASAIPDALPFVAVSMFSGTRASEARQLTWGDIDLLEGFVQVRAGVSKTKRPRAIPMSENLKAWLLPYRGKDSDLIVPQGGNSLRTQLRKIHSDAGVQTIKHGMRHSFASYLLARDKDITGLTLAMGHDDAETTFRHYHRAATERDAKKFWSIKPAQENPGSIIVPMRGAAA
jgi:integrase